MEKLLKFVDGVLVMLMKLSIVAAIGGLGYAIWRFCFLFAACGTELKVIIMTAIGIVIAGIILFDYLSIKQDLGNGNKNRQK
jgi:hypothetical protein